jgi:leader peptidase (prepilin peptidase)/N-methyltransferase
MLQHLPPAFVYLYVAAVGAIIGSFLNVVIYRLPRRQSVVRPRSSCPSCGAKIRWYDNVPVLSWLFLRARCRDCKATISARYPLVEALASAAGLLALYRYGLTLVGFEVAIFAWATIALGLIDLEHQILPDVITYPAIVFGLVCSWYGGLASFRHSLLGGAFGALILITVIFAYRLIRGEEGMGWGDVKYLAAIGTVMGIHRCVWVLLGSSVVGATLGAVLILVGRGSGKTALPFGTFLAVAVLAILYIPDAWFGWTTLAP